MRKEMAERLFCARVCQQASEAGQGPRRSHNQQSVSLIFTSVHIGGIAQGGGANIWRSSTEDGRRRGGLTRSRRIRTAGCKLPRLGG